MKQGSCINPGGMTEREIQINRIELIKSYEIVGPEYWMSLKEHPNYLVSSKGRLKHLKSYKGKSRVLCPSVKYGKYLYYTITTGGKRFGIALNVIIKNHFVNWFK